MFGSGWEGKVVTIVQSSNEVWALALAECELIVKTSPLTQVDLTKTSKST